MSAFLGEIIGTMILIIFGCGVNGGTTLFGSYSKGAGWIVITFGWGLAVMLGIYAVGSISGAHMNPAVTLGLVLSGDFPLADAPSYFLAQMIGAILGATIVWLQYLPHWGQHADPAEKLGVFSTSPAIPSRWANLMSEVIGTFALVLGLLFIGANEFTEGLNPLIVGLLIVALGMSIGGSTGYAINPARDWGPRIAHSILPIKGKGDSNWGYAWIPMVGPLLGGAFGAVFYNAVFKGMMGLPFWIVSAIVLVVVVLAVMEDGKKVAV